MEGGCARARNITAEEKRKKILLAGDADVGKTSLTDALLRLNGISVYRRRCDEFASCGIDVGDSKFTIDIYELQCLDFNFIFEKFLGTIDVVVLCYAVDNVQSFHTATEKWLENLKITNPTKPIVFVATKCDLRHRIAFYRGEREARYMNAYQFFECSAFTKVNVKEVFVSAVRSTLAN